MAGYPFKTVEKKWQSHWEREATFRTPKHPDTSRPKFYVLDMFPYPSGDGLHVGHPEGYTATDIVARFKRMRGFNVLHPMGWDAFGLPAEQHAIKTGTHPRVTTEKNTSRFRQQLKALGLSYDWEREINTTDPAYYRWTQWIFKQLFDRGLAYQEDKPVWWCEALGTTLANEEVVDGLSDIGSHPCVRRPLRQWVLKITEYADELLAGLDDVDWPRSTKEMQRNWIGRSEGAEIDFPIVDHTDATIRVFTTRPDTLFGATYMVLAPEHPLVTQITSSEQSGVVQDYVELAAQKSDRERAELQKEKTGVFTGAFALNPATKQSIPIWIADYVLASYGTGAIMAVPGQDERDWEFAEVYELPIIRTVEPPADFDGKAYLGDGAAINSGFLNGLPVTQAKTKMIDWLEGQAIGERKINFKLRDWLFSRQRYWGEPFPIVFEDDTARTVDEEELPVLLPDLEEFKPSGSPEGPLAAATAWLEFTDPSTGKTLRRETNTMPQWAGSCWYFLRYIDPENTTRLVDPALEAYWMPVDLYVGGAEHAVLHLLYARFWHKVLHDAGFVSTPEPFLKLVHQGMILGELEFTAYKRGEEFVSANALPPNRDGIDSVRIGDDEVTKRGDHFVLQSNPSVRVEARAHKMSKSRGNVVNPDTVLEQYGADAFRLYEMFMGPLEAVKPWSSRGVEGTFRFLNRTWRLLVGDGESGVHSRVTEDTPNPEQLRALHATIRKVTDDIEHLRFNTAISSMMEFINAANKWDVVPRAIAIPFVQILNPFAPHIAEELWERLGQTKNLSYTHWPEANEAFLAASTLEIAVQVNGKLRGNVTVDAGLAKEGILDAARNEQNVSRHVEGKNLVKEIYVPGKIVNFVVK